MSINIGFTEVDGSCFDNDTGTVIIDNSTGTAPFNITYNGNNLKKLYLSIENEMVGNTKIDAKGCFYLSRGKLD